MPEVTVSIPTLNEEEFLSTCLDDLKKAIEFYQEYSFEVNIVDSDSTDATIEIAENHDVVDEIYNEEKGILKARDKGIREASGDIVVCMDADTSYPENFLAELLQPFEEKDSTVLSYGRAKGERTDFHIDSLARKIWQNSFPLIGLCWVNGSNRALKKSVYLRMNGYDISKNGDSVFKVMYEEQFMFPLKMKKHGHIEFVRSAESFQSHRTVDQLMLLERKVGGRSWNFIEHYGFFSIFRNYILRLKHRVLT